MELAPVSADGGHCAAPGLKSGDGGVREEADAGGLGLAAVIQGGAQGVELSLIGAVEHAVDPGVVQAGLHPPYLRTQDKLGGLPQGTEGLRHRKGAAVLLLVLKDHHAAGGGVFQLTGQIGKDLKTLHSQSIVPWFGAVEEGELSQIGARRAAGRFSFFQHRHRMAGPGQSSRRGGRHDAAADKKDA